MRLTRGQKTLRNALLCILLAALVYAMLGFPPYTVRGMLDRVEEELGCFTTVVATGGMAQFIVPLCRREIKLERDLLLKGLNIIYQKNRKS